MKKIKILFSILAVAVFAMSCDDDGGTSVLPIDYAGAIPNIQKSATTDAFFDLVKVGNGENVSVAFSADIGQGSPASTDIVGIYTTSSGLIYHATLFSDVSLPQDFTLDANGIVAAFSEINTTADIGLADVLTITARFTMQDGVVLNMRNEDGTTNLNSNLTNSALFVTEVNYPVSCPSDIGGNYTVVSSGFSTDGAPVNNPLVDFSYDIVLTDNGGGSYSISDGVAGVYQDWYCAPYGYCFETAGTFTDVCGTLGGSWTEAFGCQVDLTGTVNPDGTLTIEWVNCFGDTIEEAIYTPQ